MRIFYRNWKTNQIFKIFSYRGNFDADIQGVKQPVLQESGTVDGVKGIYSSSSSKVDESGRGTYNVESGKIV